MKTLLKLVLTVLFSILATSPQAVANGLSPFSMNSLDPTQGTAAAADIFQDVATIEGMEANAGEFIAPAWLEILVLISPANFPISTFLTQKVLDGVRGLAKAQSMRKDTKFPDILIETKDGNTRFNSNARIGEDYMKNNKQFSNESISNYKLNWGEIAVIPYQDTISTGAAGGGATATLTMTNINMWTQYAQMKLQGLSYVTGSELIVHVDSVNTGANTLVIRSIDADGATVLPVIADGTKVTRMGTAHPSLGVKNDSVNQYPTSDYNYAQKFITSVVYSNWLMLTQMFSNYSFSMITNLALQDFRYGQEYSFMFGLRSKFLATKSGGGTEQITTTAGLKTYIDQEIEYGTGGGNTTITETDIVDFTKAMRVGNNGSDTRYLFAGSDLISALNKGVMSDSTRFVQKDYDTVYGLSFTVLYSFFGTINVMYAPLMDQTEYISKGFLLDMQFVDKFVFQPFRQTETDLVKLRDSDAASVDMVETCGLVVRNTDTHHIFVVKA